MKKIKHRTDAIWITEIRWYLKRPVCRFRFIVINEQYIFPGIKIKDLKGKIVYEFVVRSFVQYICCRKVQPVVVGKSCVVFLAVYRHLFTIVGIETYW